MIPEPNIYLYSGKKIEPVFLDGMYRATVDGSNYCSATFGGLVEALGFFHSIYVASDPIPVPERPLSEILGEMLASKAPLVEKQKAFLRLEALAITGDGLANKLLGDIRSKPVSFGASCITKYAGKKDFAEVTPVEISELVGNVVHRSELLLELAERVNIGCLQTQTR